jgi:[ribosomal protein S5]-alanine N-acetyltransferase
MLNPQLTWETARLVARPAASADAESVFECYASDPAVATFMTWRPHRGIGETVEFLRRCEQEWIDGSAFSWTLWMKGRGELAGVIEMRPSGAAVVLGYALGRRWWRQGLMSEALTAVVQWALARPEIYRVWATCDVENVASARVLERVGMEREGVLRRWLVHPNLGDTPRDCLCYAIVKASETVAPFPIAGGAGRERQ